MARLKLESNGFSLGGGGEGGASLTVYESRREGELPWLVGHAGLQALAQFRAGVQTGQVENTTQAGWQGARTMSAAASPEKMGLVRFGVRQTVLSLGLGFETKGAVVTRRGPFGLGGTFSFERRREEVTTQGRDGVPLELVFTSPLAVLELVVDGESAFKKLSPGD